MAAAANVSGPPRLPVIYSHPEADAQLTKLLSNPKAKGRLGITGTMAHCPAVTTPFGNLGNALISTLELSDHRRELVIVRTATLAKSPFEMTQHLPVVRQLKGWTDASVAEVMSGKLQSPLWDDADRCILPFVDEVFKTVTVSDATFDALAMHLTARELVEVTMLVGNYTMLAGFLNTMRVANDPIVGGGSMFFKGNDAQKNRGKPYAKPGAAKEVPRLPMLTPETCDPRAEVKKLVSAGTSVINGVMAHSPDVTLGFAGMGSVFLNKLELSHHRRELVIVRTGGWCASPFEITQHVPVATDLGWTDMHLTEVLTGKLNTAQFWDEADRAILQYVDELLGNVCVSDATFDAVARHLTRREIVEITMMPGQYRMLAGFLNTMKIPVVSVVDPAFLKWCNGPNKQQEGKAKL